MLKQNNKHETNEEMYEDKQEWKNKQKTKKVKVELEKLKRKKIKEICVEEN